MSDEYTPSVERAADLYAWAYAWRVTDEDDETDMSGARERQRAEFNRMIAQVKAEAQVEALREIAQAWQTDGWAQDMPPRDSQRHQLIVGMAQRATDFIRDRADRIAREAGIETGAGQ